MVYMSFTFGPDGSYFFNGPTQWARKGLPSAVESLFTKSAPIKEVYEMAFGENGSYYVGYRDSDGKSYCKKWGLPPTLMEWLGTDAQGYIIRDIPTIGITLGANGAYFAMDKTGAAQWENLPDAFRENVHQRLDGQNWKPNQRPWCFDLGYDGSYILTSEGGGGTWNLRGQNDELDAWLKNANSLSDIAGIWLDTFNPGAYVMVFTDGRSHANMPKCCWDDYKTVAQSIPDMRPTAQATTTARPGGASRQQSGTSRRVGRMLAKGAVTVVKHVAINLITGSSGGGTYDSSGYSDGGTYDSSGYSGGGGLTYSSGGVDTSSSWDPVSSAASAPIQ